MVGIGVFQMKSKEPVGFYSGEKPPEAGELSDVGAWNKRHGIMWLVYGVLIVLSYIVGILVADSVWCLFLVGVIVPIPVMIWYHHQLIRKYKQ